VQQPSTTGLVSAAASGDASAWRELVDRYEGLVWSVARAHRLGPADAADVSQTTWLRLVENLGRLREPEHVGGWLATTARHECLRVIRRHGREVLDGDVEPTPDRSAEDISPESAVLADERRVLLWRALGRLSLRCQTLLRSLAAAPEGGYAEISAALGMPIGSIGPTRARCLERLRRELVDAKAVGRG